MNKKYTLLIYIIYILFLTQPTPAIEISTLSPDNETTIEGAIEYTNSLRAIRQKTYMTLRQKYINNPTYLNNLSRKLYNAIDMFIFGVGSSVTVHEVGHANAYKYNGATYISLGTGNNNDASLLEIYTMSVINGGAFATSAGYTSAIYNSPTRKTLESGAGTNANWTFKNRILINSLQQNKLTFTEHNDLAGTHLAVLIYINEPLEDRTGNDFKIYLDSMQQNQGYDISIESLRTQFLLSSLLSYTFTPIYIENSRINSAEFKSIKLNNLRLFYPEFTPYLMPTAVTQQVELFFKLKQLASLAYEFPMYGNKSQTEVTLGWYPVYNKLNLKFRLSITNTFNTYLSMNNEFELSKRFNLMTKAFIGNLSTFAQKREALSNNSTYALGIHYKL